MLFVRQAAGGDGEVWRTDFGSGERGGRLARLRLSRRPVQRWRGGRRAQAPRLGQLDAILGWNRALYTHVGPEN